MTEPVEAKLDNLHVGQKAEFTETITESMIQEFAKLSGDYNPHHIDEEYAKEIQDIVKKVLYDKVN